MGFRITFNFWGEGTVSSHQKPDSDSVETTTEKRKITYAYPTKKP